MKEDVVEVVRIYETTPNERRERGTFQKKLRKFYDYLDLTAVLA